MISNLSAVEDEKLLLLASLFLAAFVTLSSLESRTASSSPEPSTLASSTSSAASGAGAGVGSTTITAFTSVKSSCSEKILGEVENGAAQLHIHLASDSPNLAPI